MIGTKLAHFTITAHLGSGGMGEVYQATDGTLGRSVAIKLLPEAFAHDEERAARFDREARVLASLNHPNIAAIYGIEQSNERRFLVMELVGGETLAERVKRGPIPVNEALEIAKQIAEALEAAHDSEKAIIHRDLKPANVKITPDGKVKVLDFGLAKAYEPPATNANLSNSPTLSIAATNVGVILGTAAYMSPEQAKGRIVDKRTDIFAFGCVLYEMLTGRAVFGGEDVTDILSRVLRREPDWTLLPADVPPRIRELLKLCLQKDARKRRQAAGDVRIDIEHALAEPVVLTPSARSSRGAWIVAASVVLVAALAGLAVLYFERPQEISSVQFLISTPVIPAAPHNGLAVSPNGRSIAFVAAASGNTFALFIRDLDSAVPRQLAGTEGAGNPFWSPDSRFIAFSADGLLKKIDVSGGPPLTLCEMNGINRAGTWNSEDTIVFANNVLYRVSAAGGQPTPVTALDQSRQETFHTSPYFLPDGRHFLYSAWSTEESNRAIYIGSLDSEEHMLLLQASSKAVYAEPGYLFYHRQGTLFAQAFDADKFTFTAEPVWIADQVGGGNSDGAHTAYSVSQNGILAYRTEFGAENTRLAWFDRTGKLIQPVGSLDPYRGVDLSPDGLRVAFHSHELNGGDVWLLEFERGATSRLTFDSTQDNSSPIWSPDGKRIAFSSRRKGKRIIYVKSTDGTGDEESIVESVTTATPMGWSPDGNVIIYWVIDPRTGTDVAMVPLTGDRKPLPLLQTRFNETSPQISPDGKWMAYSSNESGRNEIYIRSFPDGVGKWQISTQGGFFPRFRGDGKELYFLSSANLGKMMAASIEVAGDSLRPTVPHELFDSGYVNVSHENSGNYHAFSVSSDGRRFLIPRPDSASAADLSSPPPITVVLNWTAALQN